MNLLRLKFRLRWEHPRLKRLKSTMSAWPHRFRNLLNWLFSSLESQHFRPGTGLPALVGLIFHGELILLTLNCGSLVLGLESEANLKYIAIFEIIDVKRNHFDGSFNFPNRVDVKFWFLRLKSDVNWKSNAIFETISDPRNSYFGNCFGFPKSGRLCHFLKYLNFKTR